MSEVINPVDVERNIRELSDRISEGVHVVSKRESAYMAAEREFTAAYAAAYLAYEGPQQEKRYHADLETMDAREARDTAQAAYRYADRQAKALTEQLRAWQSVGASVRSMYSVAGRGE